MRVCKRMPTGRVDILETVPETIAEWQDSKNAIRCGLELHQAVDHRRVAGMLVARAVAELRQAAKDYVDRDTKPMTCTYADCQRRRTLTESTAMLCVAMASQASMHAGDTVSHGLRLVIENCSMLVDDAGFWNQLMPIYWRHRLIDLGVAEESDLFAAALALARIDAWALALQLIEQRQ